MEVEFQGFELETPLGGLAIGRGYTRIAGRDYFRGLAIDLPIGRLRLGWRAWEERGKESADEESYKRALLLLTQHSITFVFVLLTITFFDIFSDPGDFFVGWVAAIWGAVLVVLHVLRLVYIWLERKWL